MKTLPCLQQDADFQSPLPHASAMAIQSNINVQNKFNAQTSNPIAGPQFSSANEHPPQSYQYGGIPVQQYATYAEPSYNHQLPTPVQSAYPPPHMHVVENVVPLAALAPQPSYRVPEYDGMSGRHQGMPGPTLTNDQRSFQFSNNPTAPVRERAMSELSLLLGIPSMRLSETGQSNKRLYEAGNHHDLDDEMRRFAYHAADVPLSELAKIVRDSEGIQGDTSISNDNHNNTNNNNNNASPALLDDIPGPIVAMARTTKEKARQVFGMVWLLSVCVVMPNETVSRGRMYTRYGQVCTENNVTPLLPVSFGKLVRILYPHLTTRRLGVRGQSKYHYCGIKLNDDEERISFNHTGFPAAPNSAPPAMPSAGPELPQASAVVSSLAGTLRGSADWPGSVPQNNWNGARLRYVPGLFNLFEESDSGFPSIYPYVPPDVSYEVADTLYSLYKAHAATCVDSLSSQQPEKLVASYGCFSAALSIPVWLLYLSECMLEWIRECEVAVLGQYIKQLAKMLVGYTWSSEAVVKFKLLAHTFVGDLSESLRHNAVPPAISDIKVGGAKTFVGYLNRMLRTIEAGQRALGEIHDPVKRHEMVRDWLDLDFDDLLGRDVPVGAQCHGVLLEVLKHDVPTLLTEHIGGASHTGTGRLGNTLESHDMLMARLVQFMTELPGRFQLDNPYLFQLLSSTLLTLCLREISMTNRKSFEQWWLVRCWADEFLAWTFELGGFMSQDLRQLLVLLQPWSL